MDPFAIPSLEYLAQVQVTIAIWKHGDVRNIFRKSESTYILSWERFELDGLVLKNVLELPLPEPLKKEITCSIFPFCEQLLKWRKCINSFQYVRSHYGGDFFLDKLCFTPQGIVDGKKTTALLLKDEKLTVNKLYELACIYCLEEDIPMLWKRVRNKKRFYNHENADMVEEHELVVFWTYYIKGELSKLDPILNRRVHRCTPFQYALECAASLGNKVAVEHFWRKLTPEERNESLMRSVVYMIYMSTEYYSHVSMSDGCYSESLLFLMMQMNEEQRIEVLKLYPLKALKCLLYWPWHRFFIGTLGLMLNSLDGDEYGDLLKSISYKFSHSSAGCIYGKLFGEVWQLIPFTHKRELINRIHSDKVLLPDLLRYEDKENIGLVLSYATAAERETIIFADECEVIWESLIHSREDDFLKFLIEVCIPSEEALVKLRNTIRQRIISHNSKQFKESASDKFSKILCEIVESLKRNRTVINHKQNQAKKLCIRNM